MTKTPLLVVALGLLLVSACQPQPPGPPTKNFRVPSEDVTALEGDASDLNTLGSQILSTRATIAAADQTGYGFDLLTLLTGAAPSASLAATATPGLPSTSSTLGSYASQLGQLASADGDIEALVFITLMEASKSADEDLKAIMDEVKAINGSKAKLRDLVNQLQALNAGASANLTHGYLNGERVSGDPHVLVSRAAVYVPATGSGSALLDADQGGAVTATVTCDPGQTRAFVNASLINLATGDSLETLSADGRATFTISAQLPAGAPVPVQLKLDPAQGFSALQILPCGVVFSRDSRKSVIVRGWDPVKKQNIIGAAAKLRSLVSDFQTEAERLLDSQRLGVDDVRLLQSMTTRFARALNKNGPALAAGDSDAVGAELDDAKDSISDMSQMDMLNLQQLMDQKGQLESMLSNLMKAASDAENDLAANLK